MQSDLELWREYREGSAPAFASLVERHLDWIYSAALRRVGNSQTAEDVTQMVFLALLNEAKATSRGSLSPWLFGVVRYASANALRTEARRRRHETQAARQRVHEMEHAEVSWDSIRPLLEEAVCRLGARDREAILLRFYQQSSFAEVGVAMAISEEGARKRVARVIGKLRKYFGARGALVPEVEIGAWLLAHARGAAPAHLAGLIAVAPSSRASRLTRQIPTRFPMRAATFVAAALAGISVIFLCLQLPSSHKEKGWPALAASEPATRAVQVSFADIIAGVKQAEGRIQNLYIKNFDTTISTRAKGATNWVLTPMHYAGSAWYDGDARGKVRVYFSDDVMAAAGGPSLWFGQIKDLSWDGTEGRELTLADTTPGQPIRRMREVIVTPSPSIWLGPYTRWETGAGFTLQYMVTVEDRVSPPRPRQLLSTVLEQASRAGVAPELTGETINGFDTVRVQFKYPRAVLSYWFDPVRGYALIKVEEELHVPNYQRTQGWETGDMKQIAAGVWFPLKGSKVEEDVPNMGAYRRYDYRAEDAVANAPHFDPAIFSATIPPGWLVDDVSKPERKSYVTMEDGTTLEIHKGSFLPRVKAGFAKRPDGEAVVIPGGAWW
jgi:RNA polymerase sigma factor (sigma-70 family)